MATPAQIGARIRQARKEYQLSLKEVAEAVGVEVSTISRYETGAFERIKLPVLIGIANALHVSPEWLTWKTDNPLGDYGTQSMYEPKNQEIDYDNLLHQLAKDRVDGRNDARDKMIETHGIEHDTHMIRFLGNKSVFLYYHAFDTSEQSSAASAFMDILEKLPPSEAEHLELLVTAYMAADDRSRQMVDLALDPFLPDGLKEWTGPLAPDDISAAKELARQILQDKKASDISSPSNGDAGKGKMA